MTATLRLPAADRAWEPYTLREPVAWPRPAGPITSRVAFAAAHVVPDPLGENVPGAPAGLDWDQTLGVRRYLWSCGLGVAEAMDTAQRGMGLDWPATRELIARSAAEARAAGGRLAAGAGTDHARPDLARPDDIAAAYEEQAGFVEDTGTQVILMASRQLARAARDADDYRKVYGRVLDQVRSPVILHWLGTAFDPALAGYWGSDDVATASGVLLSIIRDHAARIDGVKVSLLDAAHEVHLRERLPDGVRLYTGDDFNYPELIRGDGTRASDALLGAFAAIAPAASAALQALDRGDLAGYDAALRPTVPLSRHVFASPTYYYKAGIAFLSWISGRQRGFTMVGGLHSARSLPHLAEAFRLADRAGLLPDPDLAAARMRSLLAVAGLE
ncbi:MAG TPA: dihydrodipicolinate synthase family protein [Streptosporangiaceae bacterium]